MVLCEFSGRVVGVGGVKDLLDGVVDVVGMSASPGVCLCLVVEYRFADFGKLCCWKVLGGLDVTDLFIAIVGDGSQFGPELIYRSGGAFVCLLLRRALSAEGTSVVFASLEGIARVIAGETLLIRQRSGPD